jgi:hypothetical protein
LVAAAAISLAVDWINPDGFGRRLVVSLVLGIALGIVLAISWRLLVKWRPGLELSTGSRAWTVLAGAEWVQFALPNDRRLVGHPTVVADPSETDSLDIYVTDAAWVEDGQYRDVTGDGILIPETSIVWAEVLEKRSQP